MTVTNHGNLSPSHSGCYGTGANFITGKQPVLNPQHVKATAAA